MYDTKKEEEEKMLMFMLHYEEVHREHEVHFE